MAGVTHVISASSALATDSDPNASPPSDGRIFEAPNAEPGELAGAALFVAPTGGTTCSVRIWYYDKTLKRWIALGTAATACPADTLTNIEPWLCPAGVDLTVQVTANTGVVVIGVGFLGSAR